MPATHPQSATTTPLELRESPWEPLENPWEANPGAYAGEVCAFAEGERTWIALGSAWKASWEHTPEPGAVAATCSAWLERLPQAPDAELAAAPWIWGGQAFFSRGLAAPWSAWPVAELRVPQHLILVEGDRRRVLSFVDAPLPRPRAPRPSTARLTAVESQPSREAWVAHAGNARDEVVKGEVNKLVPVRATRFGVSEGLHDVARVWRALGGAPGTRYCWSDGVEAFVGRTPERLVELRGDTLHTVALAGTAPRGGDAEADRQLGEALLADPKIEDEHQAVVHGIAARLTQAGLELDPPPVPRLRKLAEAQHVETPLRAARRGRVLWDLVEALHPTPALGGEPRAAAQRWLEAHELLERGWFGAPLGWVDRQGDGAAWVAIRGVLLQGAQAWAYAGAGVVAGSDPAAEWDETELKLTPVKGALEAARGEDL